MTENPLRGIALMVVATICFSLSDAMAKHLVGHLPAIEIAWIRYIVFVLMATTPMLRSRHASMRTRRPWHQVARGLGIVASSLTFIMALSSLPLAEAAAVSFASPLFITILAIPFLGELVGLRGWLAVILGFVGVLIVVRPGTGAFHPAALWVVASSLCWAVSMIVTRRMAGTERPAVTLLWTAGTGLVALTALLPFSLAPVTAGQLGFAIAIGMVASSGQWFAILAYRLAAASVLAPLSYGQLIWSSFFGFIAFGALPDGWTLVGAVIIIGSGLYTVQRERMRLRAVAGMQRGCAPA